MTQVIFKQWMVHGNNLTQKDSLNQIPEGKFSMRKPDLPLTRSCLQQTLTRFWSRVNKIHLTKQPEGIGGFIQTSKECPHLFYQLNSLNVNGQDHQTFQINFNKGGWKELEIYPSLVLMDA